MGVNARDFGLFSYPGFRVPSKSSSLLTVEETRCVFKSTFKDNATHMMEVYPPRRSYGLFDNRDLVFELGTDLVFACPANKAARALAAKGAAAWVYSFRRRPSCSPMPFPGPVHGAEMAYVFGNQVRMARSYNLVSGSSCQVSPQDEALSRTFMGLWATFARQGAPSAAWPRWAPGADPVLKLELSSPSRLTTESGFRSGQCGAQEAAGVRAEDITRLVAWLAVCQGPRLRRLAGEAPAILV